ncbi:hypothetical protein BGZ65_000517, partial [Modicella reniformis]
HLTLYAPVTEGKQSIRVLVDIKERGYNDCEVLTIDGQDALTHLHTFSETIGYSKDSGVRLNLALGSYIYDRKQTKFVLSAGGFSERIALPDKGSLTYVLKCAASPTPITLEEPWIVIKMAPPSFTDYKSYLSNICHPPSSADIQNFAMLSSEDEPLLPARSALFDLSNP